MKNFTSAGYKQKAARLIKKIEIKYSEYVEIETSAAERAIRLGSLLIELKEIVKMDKRIKWTSFIRKKLPFLSIRTIQRYMKMSKKVDLESCPALAYLGQVRLCELIKLTDKENTVNDFLEDKGIETEIDFDDENAISSFRKDVDNLLGDVDGRDSERENPSEGKSLKSPKNSPKDRSGNDLLTEFNNSSKALGEHIDSIIDDEDLLSKIDEDWVDDLLEKLKELKERLDELDE
jgi:hypothetical protein